MKRMAAKMMETIVAKLIIIFLGFLFGSLIPLAFIYIGLFLKKKGFSNKTVLAASLRVLLVPFLLVFVLLLMGLMLDFAGLTEPQPNDSTDNFFLWFIFSIFAGFFVGLLTLIYSIFTGIRNSRKQKKMGSIQLGG